VCVWYGAASTTSVQEPSTPISIEDEEGIMFTGEIKDDRPVVKGGTVEKLVERLTFPAYAGMRNDIAARYSWFVAASTYTPPSARSLHSQTSSF